MDVVLPTLGPERRKTYSPFLPICPETGKVLEVAIVDINLDSKTIKYQNGDKKVETKITGGACKLQWKVDWAMRWFALGVDFEMYGKDLIPSAELSSKICKILGGTPPAGFAYELFFPLNSMTKVGHVYLIDDDESMRLSLTRMLRELGYLVEEYASAKVFLDKSVPVSPAVILLDMQMPDMTGLDLQESLRKLGRKTPIVFVSGQSHPHQIVQGLKRGALDFLFKPFNLEELLNAVADAIDFDGRQLQRVSIDVETKRDYEKLTPREREVCAWLVKGLLNKDIAVKLGTTDATIKVHKARVMEKMHADSLQTLVKKYLESDLENHPLTV